jgi:hypothetical protein
MSLPWFVPETGSTPAITANQGEEAPFIDDKYHLLLAAPDNV